jgi:hypothetical protein
LLAVVLEQLGYISLLLVLNNADIALAGKGSPVQVLYKWENRGVGVSCVFECLELEAQRPMINAKSVPP